MKVNLHKLIKKNPFILAPMDDVTDIGFRKICEENEASYSTTELTSVEALIRDKVFKSRYERGKLKINSVQLFGSKPESFVLAAKKVSDQADIIDVNFGCPSATVTNNDSGSMLLKDPKNVGKIIEKLVKNIDKPITAKIRLGYSKTTYNEVAKEVEDAGAQILAVHGRTAKQKYSGLANWDAIREVHEKLKIPVIGNGDIKSEEDIDKYLLSESPYASALMVGRAAIGNPYIFKKFNHYYKTGKKLNNYDVKSKQKELFLEYLNLLEEHDFYNLPLKIQRQGMWFFKGIEGAKELRTKIQKTKDRNEIMKIIEEF